MDQKEGGGRKKDEENTTERMAQIHSLQLVSFGFSTLDFGLNQEYEN